MPCARQLVAVPGIKISQHPLQFFQWSLATSSRARCDGSDPIATLFRTMFDGADR
jgi:hypothetical protein